METRKKYHAIGEVSRMLELKAHVLHFWEKEFSALHPHKNSAGMRMYVQQDIDLLFKIKYLLYEEKFTIEGARERLEVMKTITLDRYKQLSSLALDQSFWTELEEISQLL